MSSLKVLFVDDEPEVLARLKDELQNQGDGWSFAFAESGRKALVAMDIKNFDAIVVDTDMPNMDGPKLLKKVQRRFPGTVRIILSTGMGAEMGLKSLGFAHQALPKSTSPANICMAISRTFRMRDLFLDKSFHRQISRIRSLPTPPPTYRELVKEFQAQEPSIKKIAGIISHDTGLTAKMLQILNSAFFGLPTRITSPLHAVTLLGLDMIQTLALASGVFRQFEVQRMGYITPEWISDHGIAVGKLAKQIAEELELSPEICENSLLAGMLHDVGKLMELAFFRDQFKGAFDTARRDDQLLVDAEREQMGVGHSEMGAHLMGLWGMPNSVVEAIAFHHCPLQAGDLGLSELVTVHIADALIWETYDDLKPQGGGLDKMLIKSLNLEDKIQTIREKLVETIER
ncbi:MAG: response regulator [bacterium]|nr:response regulator [bacterium]